MGKNEILSRNLRYFTHTLDTVRLLSNSLLWPNFAQIAMKYTDTVCLSLLNIRTTLDGNLYAYRTFGKILTIS